MKVPFVDLKAQYRTIKPEIDAAIQSVINEAAFIHGRHVEKFEKAFARMYEGGFCISVANGTDALYITLKALGIGRGDEVITVANSWISTSEAITQTGARPVFVDIEPEYYTIDASKIIHKITPKTKAVIPVHLYGQSAEIDAIQRICLKHGLYLVEDCAQAHFVEYKGQKVGTFGVAGTFSFFPGKNLGAYGDAGAIITHDKSFALRARMYANHGALQKHFHQIEGINSRMDGIQAAILNVKLPHIHEWNLLRAGYAKRYSRLLKGIDAIRTPQLCTDTNHIFHLYVIRCKDRENLRAFLESQGVSTGIHYPTILPLLPAYKYLQHVPEDFPTASDYQNQILSLPMYPEMGKNRVEYVATQIKTYYSGKQYTG